MKNNILILLSGLLMTILISSCSTVTTRLAKTSSFAPDEVRLELTTEDIVFLGEEEVTVVFNRYLGFINHTMLINNNEVARRNSTIVDYSGKGNFSQFTVLTTRLRRAAYEVHVKYPDADFFIPTYVITEKNGMFMGSRFSQKMKIKAYKFKK